MEQVKGITLITISAILYASYGLWSRLMSGNFGEFNQAYTRSILILCVLLPYILLAKKWQPIKSADWKWFIAIGLAGGLNQAPYYFGFQHLPIGTAILIFYASLMLSGYLLGKYVFHETITTTKKISFVVALIGMIVIYRFSLADAQLIPAIAMAIAGMMGGTAGILPKKLSSSYPEPQIMMSYLIIMIVVNLPLSIMLSETLPSLTNQAAWLSQLGYAGAMLFANLTVIAGFKYLSATVGTLIGLSEILFGVLIGILFFAERPTVSTLLGGLFIVSAAMLPLRKK